MEIVKTTCRPVAQMRKREDDKHKRLYEVQIELFYTGEQEKQSSVLTLMEKIYVPARHPQSLLGLVFCLFFFVLFNHPNENRNRGGFQLPGIPLLCRIGFKTSQSGEALYTRNITTNLYSGEASSLAVISYHLKACS